MNTRSRALLAAEPHVVTAGVDLFADALAAQAVPTTAVEWRPPMAGSEDALARVMADERRAEANRAAVEAMLRSTGLQVLARPEREIFVCRPRPEGFRSGAQLDAALGRTP